MSINKVFISGNLTRDPEMRTTQGGTVVMGLGVAVNDRRKNPNTGQWEDVPNYFDLTMFGNRAQAVSQYLGKGTKVMVDGELRWRSWADQNGQKHTKVEVIVNEIEFARAAQPTQNTAFSTEDLPF